ncbi:glutamine synthetase family protein [Aminicella lysinilytica]|uniref:Glutamine synthetase n=1 Tax=Aminicella lysinilytica TaxID=433323 RepID=A0A4R6QF04_9FIRM|nr:glutamine synthetase [Aminicella lysinilytica]
MYSYEDIMTFVEEEDVRFIRLAFCDVKGVQKNIAIMPGELKRAFESGISFDASAIEGFGAETKSDLFLFPDPQTLVTLPWRPTEGRVVRMFCDIRHPDGSPFALDGRRILADAVEAAAAEGIKCFFGAEFEFYLFKTDDDGNPTISPYDSAGYFDIAPADRGENIRREICINLDEMGIRPEASHHEEGPGQQEIDFKFSDPLSAADNATAFKNVVKMIAMANGAAADFSPRPLDGKSGNGMHINMSVSSDDGRDVQEQFMAGIMEHIREITYFLDPLESSYARLGEFKAPKFVTWSPENRSQLIRIPAAAPENRRIELRSPDPAANPYIAYALLIYAGIDGIERELAACEPSNTNLYRAEEADTRGLGKLPETLEEARQLAKSSAIVREVLPAELVEQI